MLFIILPDCIGKFIFLTDSPDSISFRDFFPDIWLHDINTGLHDRCDLRFLLQRSTRQ